ncbi:MAG: AEC family transporter [Clostridia bacterium]|nr:AEC family transporter [Clostridia bacterium]
MSIIRPLIENVIVLFVMMVPGILLKKCRLVTEEFGKGISNLVLYIAQPALILYAYLAYEGEGDIWINSLWVLLFSVVAHALFAAVALLCFRRAEDGRRRMLRFVTVFSNAAFMGIPLISVILGPEATIYASVYNITFNVFLWSLGVYFCTARRDEDGDGTPDGEVKPRYTISPLRVALHPVNVASVLGIVLLLCGVHTHTPALVLDCLDMLRALVAPLAMVVIGLRVAGMSFRGAFRDKYLYLFLALRHFLLPTAVLLVFLLFKLVGLPMSDTVVTVVLLLAATPAATSATMFAEKYDCDATYTSRTVTVSTLLSLVSMPLLMMLSDVMLKW